MVSSLPDHIFIEALEVDVLVGAYTMERFAPQRVVINLDIGFDFQRAIQTDQLPHTLDYDRLITSLRQTIAQTRHTLLETLADTICRHCIEQYHAHWVRVQLYKPDILTGVGRVGITLTRHARDYTDTITGHYDC